MEMETKSRADTSPHPFPLTLNDDSEIAQLSNSELISLLESSFYRSEFIRVACILNAREESAKSKASKDFTANLSLREAAITDLQDKNASLEMELRVLKTNEAEFEERFEKAEGHFRAAIGKLEQEMKQEKDKYLFLKGSYDKMELAKIEAVRCRNKLKKDCRVLRASEKESREKIKGLMKEVQNLRDQNEKLFHLKVEIRTLECANKIAQDEVDAYKRKFLEIEQKEFVAMLDLEKQRSHCLRLEEMVCSMKSQYFALELLKENAEQRYKILKEEAQLMTEAATEKIAKLEVNIKELGLKTVLKDELDQWKSKYSLLEVWILRFLENNRHLVGKVREGAMNMNGEKQNMDVFSIIETSAELLKSDTTSDRKESFLPTRIRSKDLIDLRGRDVELVGASFEDNVTPIRSSDMKCSLGRQLDSVGSNRNCSRKRAQLAETSGIKLVLECNDDDDDDVVCTGERVKRF